jgi:hypothetical protein
LASPIISKFDSVLPSNEQIDILTQTQTQTQTSTKQTQEQGKQQNDEKQTIENLYIKDSKLEKNQSLRNSKKPTSTSPAMKNKNSNNNKEVDYETKEKDENKTNEINKNSEVKTIAQQMIEIVQAQQVRKSILFIYLFLLFVRVLFIYYLSIFLPVFFLDFTPTKTRRKRRNSKND